MTVTRGERLIAYKKDIDAILAEKFDIPLDVAKKNTTYIVNRLIDMQQDENIFKIHLSPDLGYMYCTQNMTIKARKRMVGFEDTERALILDKKIAKISSAEFNKGIFRKIILKPPRINRRWFRMNKTKRELDEFQNKKYNEQKNEHN